MRNCRVLRAPSQYHYYQHRASSCIHRSPQAGWMKQLIIIVLLISVSGANSYSVSLDSSQSPSGAAAPALRDSFEDEAFEPIVRIKNAHVEARQSRRPDAQVGEARRGAGATADRPGTSAGRCGASQGAAAWDWRARPSMHQRWSEPLRTSEGAIDRSHVEPGPMDCTSIKADTNVKNLRFSEL